jgi:hypothetical protein
MSLADLTRAEAQLPDDPPDPDLKTDAAVTTVTALPEPPSDWTDLDRHGAKKPRPESPLERHLRELLTA